ncbi:MAG: HAMP domain-containing histidine kinase, partial [Leptonema sp. (in: Bacteria)]|nr:HAMP domain-containing histidine kinase [Leptonema sp. (in: bacteria)]
RLIHNRAEICPFCPLENEWKNAFSETTEVNETEDNRPYRVIEKIISKTVGGVEKSFKITFILIRTNSIRIVEMIEDITAERERQEEMLRLENLAAMGTMVSGVAHELNNPLTGISLTLQNLLANITSMAYSDVLKRLQSIQKDLSKASRIIQDILSLARPGLKENHPVLLLRLIEKAKENTIRLYPVLSRKINFEIRSADDFVVRADTDKIERLFFNLFRNAIQAYDYKEGSIRVELKRLRGSVVIIISDNAGGIPPDILKRIFVPFHSGQRTGRGTGLGLPICLSIVKEHGGRMKIRSKDGQTFFFISLPRIDNHG